MYDVIRFASAIAGCCIRTAVPFTHPNRKTFRLDLIRRHSRSKSGLSDARLLSGIYLPRFRSRCMPPAAAPVQSVMHVVGSRSLPSGGCRSVGRSQPAAITNLSPTSARYTQSFQIGESLGHERFVRLRKPTWDRPRASTNNLRMRRYLPPLY